MENKRDENSGFEECEYRKFIDFIACSTVDLRPLQSLITLMSELRLTREIFMLIRKIFAVLKIFSSFNKIEFLITEYADFSQFHPSSVGVN